MTNLTVPQRIEWLRRRHEYWFHQLREHTGKTAVVLPELALNDRLYGVPYVGIAYGEKKIEYVTPYLIGMGDAFDETVCHEMCHIFDPRSGHGESWLKLIHNWFPAARYDCQSTATMRLMARRALLIMKEHECLSG